MRLRRRRDCVRGALSRFGDPLLLLLDEVHRHLVVRPGLQDLQDYVLWKEKGSDEGGGNING